MRRRVVVCALLLGVVLGTAAAARVPDEPPPTAGLSYLAAQEELRAWYPDVSIRVSPNGVPDGADPALLTVKTQKLENPGWSDKPPTRPEVSLTLTTQMPEVLGRPLGEARGELTRRGIAVSWLPRDAADDWTVQNQPYEAGTVIPIYIVVAFAAPGAVASACANPCIRPVVTLRVAVTLVSVPDVRTMLETQARSTLETAGLVFGLDLAIDGTVPGRVIAQDPVPGARVPRGTRVNVRVARTPPVSVPDLIGLTEAEARAALDAVGLFATIALVRDGSGPGKVVGQDPAPGTTVARGTTVTVRVERTSSLLGLPIAVVAGGGGGLLLLLLAAVGLGALLRRGRPGRAGQAGKVRVRPVFPVPQVRVEALGPDVGHVVALRPRDDPGTQVLEEVLR
ncbi:MAG TPA: PASTA domain-containing protein [Micromonosporaceae bacterium]|jgi:hypothetical protein|nr:PASTA domain-containing protein [Micromonosporaceae bacterium]